jgi:protoporphyrin/coproporphyrin ferrochelatase
MNKTRCGVLLVNLGTPLAPTAGAIRRWLREFLHDHRVIELTRWLWCPILYFFILPLRPRRLVHAYQSIWTPEGSPLMVISRQQGLALQAALKDSGHDGHKVEVAMRYGEPSITRGLQSLRASGAERILVLPMYPQYSATTTASVFDAVARAMQTERGMPELRFINDYHDDPGYIAALADSLRRHWAKQGRGDKLLMSFHGIPESYSRKGDPYHGQCHITARLLAEALQLKPEDWTLGFQSRVGKAPWLRPYTDYLIEDLAVAGIKTLDVIAPGFSVDCLETLEEIQLRYGELFRGKGGQALRYVPALNAEPTIIQALASLVSRHTQGWD